LLDGSGAAQIAVVPAYQGRIMTSHCGGRRRASFGMDQPGVDRLGQASTTWNAFGGEDRFWLGPEGGQFAIFFAKGVPFDLEHWFTPAPIDTEPFTVISQSRKAARFRQAFALTNYSGTRFQVQVDRQVKLLTSAQAWKRWV